MVIIFFVSRVSDKEQFIVRGDGQSGSRNEHVHGEYPLKSREERTTCS